MTDMGLMHSQADFCSHLALGTRSRDQSQYARLLSGSVRTQRDIGLVAGLRLGGNSTVVNAITTCQHAFSCLKLLMLPCHPLACFIAL